MSRALALPALLAMLAITGAGCIVVADGPSGPACDSTCAGCCSNGVCVLGTTLDECGVGGLECVSCGSGRGLCLTNGTCGVDPSWKLRVRVSSATISQTDSNSQAWDSVDNSGPDARPSLTCPGRDPQAVASQPEFSDSYAPAWTTGGCITTAGDLAASGFTLSIDDVDFGSPDAILPQSTIQVPFEYIADAEAYGTSAINLDTTQTLNLLGLTIVIEVVR